jgi:arylsulfatase A-like enzyme
VPLIVRNPTAMGHAVPVVDTIVEAVDVLPTILESAAIQVPPTLPGRSLQALIRGEIDPARHDSALTEHTGWKSLRTRTHRYLIHDTGEEALYDVVVEPDGLTNIADLPGSGEALADHRHRLLTRLLQRERPLPRTWPY